MFILGVAEHPNYGDFAISQAQYEFLCDNFEGEIIEFTEDNMSNPLYYDLIDAMLLPGDLIFCQGGGNHGNVYGFHERYRRNIIKRFKNNRIIIFPQTFYFTDDDAGKKEAEISKRIYDVHPDLIVAMRDRLSFDFAKVAYPNAKVVFCPDMVLYLLSNFKKEETDGSVLLLLRRGVEEKITGEEKSLLIESLNRNYNLKFNNHSAEIPVNKKNRSELIKKQVLMYSKSKVVVTDKLHGAIFAVLTGTPCVMLATFNHKIKEVSKLFADIEGYYFCEDIQSAEICVRKAYEIGVCSKPDLSKYYDAFIRIIKE